MSRKASLVSDHVGSDVWCDGCDVQLKDQEERVGRGEEILENSGLDLTGLRVAKGRGEKSYDIFQTNEASDG